MKKFSVICGLALAMLAAGCSQDTTTELNPTLKTTLSVSLDQTRTYLDGVNILWSNGDKVAINGTETSIPAAAVGTSGATFEGVTAAENYSIFYPAVLLDKNFSGWSTYTIPVVQGYTEGSFAPDTSILVGYAEHNDTKTSVALKNVYGYLKVSLTGASNVNKVYLSATAGEAISGTFSIDYATAAVTPLAGESIIRIMGVTADASGNATLVVAVPAGEYAQGFTVKAIDTDGKAMSKTLGKSAGIKIERAQLYELPTLAYAGVAQTVTSVANAYELIAALTAAASETPGNIVIESDIDMSAVTGYTPAAAFYGTIDGQGYAIKNWATTRGLIAANYGVVKNITIDSTCTLTAPESQQHVGFVVENNQSVAAKADTSAPAYCGLVSGCVNSGSITVPDVSTIDYRIGGVVGTSYGTMLNCVNNGDIDVTCTANLGNAQYIGGVVGYVNPNAGSKLAMNTAFVANCINNGDVTVVFPKQPKKVTVGGVIGATQNGKSSEAVWLGTIKNCINNGNVKYRFETLSSGTYNNVGGIIGYAQASLVNCENYGNVESSTPVENRDTNGTRAAAGGVVGCNIFDVTNCNNYGKLTVEGVWNAGTSDATLAGSQEGSSFGGVVGCTGVYDVYSENYPIKNCNNYGEVDIHCICKTDAQTDGHFGGVVGYTTNDVINCQNHGKFTSKSIVASTYAGGVVGWTTAGADNLINSGDISITFDDLSFSSTDHTKNICLAGVIGYANNSDVTNCHNNGAVSISVTPISYAITDAFLAGVLGCTKSYEIKNCSNNGTVSITVKDGITNADITAPFKNIYASGVAGYAAKVTNCQNNNTTSITVVDDNNKTTASRALYTGGIVGYARTLVDNCTLNASFTLTTGNPKTSLRCAGIVGQVLTNDGTVFTVQDCNTTAAASVNLVTKNTKASYTAGVVGLCNNGMKGCTNKAAISATASAAISTSEIFYVAGVVGRQVQTLSGCHNEGNIVANMANSTCPFYAGGVLGLNNATTSVVTGCTNSGDMTITNISTDSAELKVGGVVGYDKGTTSDSSSTGTVKVNGETL